MHIYIALVNILAEKSLWRHVYVLSVASAKQDAAA